jgi:Family of unknown function (DUF6152)
MTSRRVQIRRLPKYWLGGLLLMSALPTAAHHSFFAEFDSNRPVELTGTVSEMKWSNPHSWIVIKVATIEGNKETWEVEGGSPNVLMRLGWTRDSLKSGTRVIVRGFGAKDGSLRASSSSIEFPDGRVLDTGGSRR